MSQKKEKNTGTLKVRFSIGAKLIMIISIIVLISLGSITALVSWLVSQDLQVAAEENNFEINRRSAADAESTFEKMRSDSMILLRAVNGLGADTALAAEMEDFFFAQNQQIAA
jgi:adenylate cyclase